MTFDLPTISPKIRIGYTIDRVEQLFPNPSSAMNATSLDITKTNVMEGVFVENVEKETLTTLQKNVRKFTDVQTVVETTECMQKLMKNGKEQKRSCLSNTPETYLS